MNIPTPTRNDGSASSQSARENAQRLRDTAQTLIDQKEMPADPAEFLTVLNGDSLVEQDH